MKLCSCECNDFRAANFRYPTFNYCSKYGRACLEDKACYENMPPVNEVHTAFEISLFGSNAKELNDSYAKELPDELTLDPDSGGKKYDEHKLRWDLLPLHLIEKTVEVLTFGASKYGPNNWQKVEDGEERYYAALMRHIIAYRNGEECDKESKLSHLAHAMCNLVFLDWLYDKN